MLQQFATQGQNEIILIHNKSQETSLAIFNKSLQELQQALQLIQIKDTEIKRLQELCTKNKIDIQPKPKNAPSDTTKPQVTPKSK